MNRLASPREEPQGRLEMNRLASPREEWLRPPRQHARGVVDTASPARARSGLCYIEQMNGELRTLLRLPAAGAFALGLLLLRLAR